MRGPREFCQRGSWSNSNNVFMMRGKRIQIALKASHHRLASETPLNGVSQVGRLWATIECWLGSFVIFQRVRTSIAKKPYIFVIFHGGGGVRTPCPPSGSAHEMPHNAAFHQCLHYLLRQNRLLGERKIFFRCILCPLNIYNGPS